jgi:hypothetical protein
MLRVSTIVTEGLFTHADAKAEGIEAEWWERKAVI